MANRKHISLIYQYNDNWIGGTYYILNILKVLNLLPQSIKPEITIFYNDKNSIAAVKQINYPHINYVQTRLDFNFAEKIINKLYWILLGEVLIKIRLPGKRIENLYPASIYIDTSNIETFYYWIPDFQEHYLPDFFSKWEITDRKKIHRLIKNSNQPVVFSSENALSDFNDFYPKNFNKKKILKFVSLIDKDFEKISIESLKSKFSIKKIYFIIPNQFWQHKNQFLVIKATKILIDKGFNFQIVFTGKEYDHRNPDFILEIKKYVKSHHLENHISFLGFIDRNEQLQLMKNALAIIQPSLFEGWSTVVEDAKSMGQFILLSDIPVHKEQIQDNCLFFNPRDDNDLAIKMEKVLLEGRNIKQLDYRQNVLNFSKELYNIFN
ncbi:MAG TPA: glycosyltransferase [Flavobacterium sp.]|nr:glycosyltransferase [Flavobacterium sp.]